MVLIIGYCIAWVEIEQYNIEFEYKMQLHQVLMISLFLIYLYDICVYICIYY